MIKFTILRSAPDSLEKAVKIAACEELVINQVTAATAITSVLPTAANAKCRRAHNLETSPAIKAANTPRCSLMVSVDRIGLLGCKSLSQPTTIDALPNRLSRTDALPPPGPAPIRPGVRLTHGKALQSLKPAPARVRNQFYWSWIIGVVHTGCCTCTQCTRRKGPNKNNCAPMQAMAARYPL
ncbi:hypothetical protein T09_339 [Trichinella sp. T9]|nr:hypothetical protein T09_339 [Trichinella sp. T9]